MGFCLRAEMMLMVSAATYCYNLGPYSTHCVFSKTNPLYTRMFARIYSLVLSACTISSYSRNVTCFFLTWGRFNTGLSFTLCLHGGNPTEWTQGTARRGGNLLWERGWDPALKKKTLFGIKNIQIHFFEGKHLSTSPKASLQRDTEFWCFSCTH